MPLTGVKNIILVLSGKGGVGKSSITLQLALALSLRNHSVGILDIDLTGPSIPRLVGREDEKITMGKEGWEPVLVHEGGDMSVESAGKEDNGKDEVLEDVHTEHTNGEDGTVGAAATTSSVNGAHATQTVGSLRTMSLGYILPSRGSAVIWRGPKKTAMIRQFLSDVSWGPTDYLLVDTPPGTSDEHIALAEELHKLTSIPGADTASTDENGNPKPKLLGAVVVTTPQAVATSDVRKELNFCTKTGIPVLGVVENMAGFMCPCCGEVSNVFSMGGGEVMAQECGVRFLGRVPVDVGWGEITEGKGEGEEGEEKKERGTLVERYAKGRLVGIFVGFVEDIVSEPRS